MSANTSIQIKRHPSPKEKTWLIEKPGCHRSIGMIISFADLTAAQRQCRTGTTYTYGLAWLSGRYDWHNSYQEARDNALKGEAKSIRLAGGTP